MRRLFLKLFVFSVILFAICLTLVVVLPANEDHYIATLKDKHKRIADLPSPKIVFAGGSNVAFGIDSDIIAAETGMPVVNMGLSVNIGLDYILNELKPYIDSGDIVILIPEYTLVYEAKNPGENPDFRKLFEVFPQATRYIEPNLVLRYSLHSFVDVFQSKIKWLLLRSEFKEGTVARNANVYRRSSFDAYGDMEAHIHLEPQGFYQHDSLAMYTTSEVHPDFISALEEFSEFIHQKPAHLFYTFPPTPEKYYTDNMNGKLYEDIKNILGMNILGQPKDYVYADSLFFDTRYHLLEQSRSDRTKTVLKKLKQVLPSIKP